MSGTFQINLMARLACNVLPDPFYTYLYFMYHRMRCDRFCYKLQRCICIVTAKQIKMQSLEIEE